MKSDKNKKIFMLGFIGIVLISATFIVINSFKSKPKVEKEKTISEYETKSMLSYTLDGEKTNVKPTKDSGYIANKIMCENGSNLIWDNTNWEVEIISLESNDICSVDFTTSISTSGYRVTATTNVEGSIDSLSKTTIENGTIIFYPNKGQEITSVSGCSNGKLENNKVIVSNVTSNQTCNIEVKIPLKTLYATLSDGVKYTASIKSSFSSPEGGVSITQGYSSTGKINKIDDNNFYFSGNPSDNWVKMIKDDGTELWWRIIRTEKGVGTRLLYAGSSHDGQDGYINNTTYVWNNSYNQYYYVQWNSYSSFKSTLNSWYSSNITGTNDSMIESTTYCNDTSYTTQSGWGTNGRSYGAFDRLETNKAPSHSCGTNSFGSTAKVGMMTADEVVYAGGVYGNNAPNTYYYRNSIKSGCTNHTDDPCSVTKNNDWWTLSPYFFWGNASVFFVAGTGAPGQLCDDGVNNSYAVRPVITLKPEVKVSGSGTTDDPFVPSL